MTDKKELHEIVKKEYGKKKVRDKYHYVFAIVLLGLLVMTFFLFKSEITGWVVVGEEKTITDTLDIGFTENTTYAHELGKFYNVKSVRLSGYIVGSGSAKVYLKKDDVRYLIYEYGEVSEGINAITGYAIDDANVSLNETVEEVVDEPVNETIPLNETVEINETEPVNETLVNKTTDEPVNETIPLNETIEKEINKTIEINLEYKSGTRWDPDDDGVEDTTGVIDFTVEDTGFNWEVDDEKVCTKWSVYSVENKESTVVCYGNSECCRFLGLEPVSGLWNDVFELYYGGYDSTLTNKVSAHVIYYESLTDIYYSSEAELSAVFTREVMYFDQECMETCSLDIETSELEFIVEVEGITLNLDDVVYTFVEENINNPPRLIANISNITIIKDSYYELDLSEYFYDEDNDTLNYTYYEVDNVSISIDGNIAAITPDKNFTGTRHTYFTANDSEFRAVSNVFEVEVVEGEIKEAEQLKAEINKPVKWIKKSKNNTVNISEYASEISVNKIVGNEKSAVEEDKIKITGKEMVIEEDADSYEITYETPAPVTYEKEISKYRKQVIVSSDVHYTDILTYTAVYEVVSDKDSIKLYHIVNNSRIETHFEANDTNNNSLIDKIEWIVPHLSNETYEVDINIGNTDCVNYHCFDVENSSGHPVILVDELGNVDIKGSLNESWDSDKYVPSNDLAIQNRTEGYVAALTDEGDIKITGRLTAEKECKAPANSFIIEDSGGVTRMYIDSLGNMCYTGNLTQGVG